MEIFNGILSLLGGVGVFLVGIFFIRESLSNLASNKLEKLLARVSKNRYVAALFGAGASACLSSSGATVAIAISLVDAKIITLFTGVAIMVGANVGTSITAFFAAAGSLDIALYFGVLAIVGIFVIMLAKKERTKMLGKVLCGFGLLFVGFGLIDSAFSIPVFETFLTDFLSNYNQFWLLILASAILSALMQSSSILVAISVVLAGTGAISAYDAFFVVIGANIGTCVTGYLAAIGTRQTAKKMADIQLIYNAAGAVLFTVLLLLLKDHYHIFTFGIKNNPAFEVSMFHLVFNLLSGLLFLPFMHKLIKE